MIYFSILGLFHLALSLFLFSSPPPLPLSHSLPLSPSLSFSLSLSRCYDGREMKSRDTLYEKLFIWSRSFAADGDSNPRPSVPTLLHNSVSRVNNFSWKRKNCLILDRKKERSKKLEKGKNCWDTFVTKKLRFCCGERKKSFSSLLFFSFFGFWQLLKQKMSL